MTDLATIAAAPRRLTLQEQQAILDRAVVTYTHRGWRVLSRTTSVMDAGEKIASAGCTGWCTGTYLLRAPPRRSVDATLPMVGY